MSTPAGSSHSAADAICADVVRYRRPGHVLGVPAAVKDEGRRLAAELAAAWQRLPKQRRRLYYTLADDAAKIIPVLAQGLPLKTLGRYVIACGVTNDGGAPLDPNVFYKAWLKVEADLHRRYLATKSAADAATKGDIGH